MMEEKKWPRTWYRFNSHGDYIEEQEFVGESDTRLYLRRSFGSGEDRLRFRKKEGGSLPWHFPWRETREEAEEDRRKYFEEKERKGEAEACRDAAPEMLEALEEIVSIIKIIDSQEGLGIAKKAWAELHTCEAAIKKAKGMQ